MKAKSPLGELRALRRVIDQYTGRRLLMRPLAPVRRIVPSPIGYILDNLKW